MNPLGHAPRVLITVPRASLGGGVSAFWNTVAPELGQPFRLVPVGRRHDADGALMRVFHSLETTSHICREARASGADLVADDDETLKKIEGGMTDFDVAIATPDMMGKVGRLGRVLGPRGLMPNPNAGTVVPPQDIARAIKEAKAGRVEFRLDKTANIHVVIGKASFDAKKLYENFAALMNAINKARPAGAKGLYIKRVVVNASMGPGIKVDPNLALSAEVTE